jgi:hypothetical protein
MCSERNPAVALTATGQQQSGVSTRMLPSPAFYRIRHSRKEANPMANHLTGAKQVSVLHHLAEGNSIRATSRLCWVHRNTVMRHLIGFGESCQHFMDLSFANLHLSHLQIDEIWTFVGKKQGTLTDSEKSNPDTEFGDAYLFIGLG